MILNFHVVYNFTLSIVTPVNFKLYDLNYLIVKIDSFSFKV